uniref:Putative secreted protein n=1 Tax=Ixodes ricinus TaxID=34613 RepID=A0A6B0U7Y7_IXORI
MLHGKRKLSFPCLLFLAPSLPKQDVSDDIDCTDSKCRGKTRKLKAKAAQAPREFAGTCNRTVRIVPLGTLADTLVIYRETRHIMSPTFQAW